MKKEYVIKKAVVTPTQTGEWDGKSWQDANIGKIEIFGDGGSGHKPETKFKLLYDAEFLYVHFKVVDKYIIAKAAETKERSCYDSCVELFIKPWTGKEYFNFEINCGGYVTSYFMIDWQRVGNGFKERISIDDNFKHQLNVFHSMPKSIMNEIKKKTTWQVEYKIPFTLFEHYIKEKIEIFAGKEWTANLYKCADKSSHPHWGMWNDCTPPLNFHQPEKFGKLIFE